MLLKSRGYATPDRNRKSVKLALPDSAERIGYLAGIFDGEGSLSRSNRPMVWQLVVYNTSKPLIDWLVSLGGLGSVRSKLVSPLSKLTQYGWVLSRAYDQLVFLNAVEPYLFCKAKVVSVALPEVAQRVLDVARDDWKKPGPRPEVEFYGADADHIRRLAEDVLKRRGRAA